MTVLVTGATGTVGGSLVRQLVRAGHPVRALTRDAKAARPRLPAEVDLVQGDLGQPHTLAEALRGVDRMHLVAVDGHGLLETTAEVLDRARQAGVRRIVHLGHSDPSKDDDDPVESPHRASHRAVEQAGLEWTHLFPGEFMANTWEWAPSIKDEGVVRAPFGQWHSSMIHEADVAAIAMAALFEEGHAGRTYIPTGPAPVKRVDAVRMIGAALGREIRFIELTPAQARELWAGSYPAEVIDWFLEVGAYLDFVPPVQPDVELVTGRPGRTFEQWARDHVDDFR